MNEVGSEFDEGDQNKPALMQSWMRHRQKLGFMEYAEAGWRRVTGQCGQRGGPCVALRRWT